jgi:predicted RNA-binding Zn-ribbon protein involved in translation (DUF1610 family)
MTPLEAKQTLLDHAETVRCPKCGFTRVVKAYWNEPWHPTCINARYNEPAIYCPNDCGYHHFVREGDGGVWKFEKIHVLMATDFQLIGFDYVANTVYER